MFEDALPEKKIGYLSLNSYIEIQAYEFYRLAPPGVMPTFVPCGMQEHSLAAARRAIAAMDGLLDLLAARNVDIVFQGGLPIPLLIGPAAHDDLVRHMAQRTRRPALTQMQSVIAAMKAVGLKNVLVANRWTDDLNDALPAFFARDGIKIAGRCTRSLTPTETTRMKDADTADLAFELALNGFKANPAADGLYLGGNAWLAQPIVERLEAEVGKPVICNNGAAVWDLLRRLGKWKPLPGRGRLLETP
jgi:maleate isomerase